MIANLNTARKRNNTLSLMALAALLTAAALPLATGLVIRGVPTATIDTGAPSQGVAALDQVSYKCEIQGSI